MVLLNLPTELLCQVLHYNQVQDLNTLVGVSPYLAPFVVHECKSRVKSLDGEQALISQKRQLIQQVYQKGKIVLRDFFSRNHISYTEYRTYRRKLNENYDRDVAITDVLEYEAKDDRKNLGKIQESATKRVIAFRKRMGWLAPNKQGKAKRGHNWTRRKQHKI